MTSQEHRNPVLIYALGMASQSDITLRDLFAACALAGMSLLIYADESDAMRDPFARHVAASAYAYADAMLEARRG